MIGHTIINRVVRGLPAAAAILATVVAGALAPVAPARAAGESAPLITPEAGWSFDGVFGRYDRASLQRGFQVYNQVCSACHSMELMHYRNLGEPGGPEFSEEAVAAIAETIMVPAGPDEYGNEVDEYGQPLSRPALPSDTFRNPYQNEQAARAANGGAWPPDLSVITKARHGGADYVYSLLQGYKEPPKGYELRQGAYYNIYYPGRQFAMAQPLYPQQIEYTDGTEATLEQMAYDVTHFLAWAGEPKLEERKKLGSMVMLFLIGFAILLYLSYRKVWSNVEH